MLEPLSSATSVKLAPRLKKPTKPPVNNEKAVSSRVMVAFGMGGVQRTLPNTQGYKKERATGMQLLRKMISITAIAPMEDAARTGVMIRELIRSRSASRKADERAVTSAPARDPRPKATRVAPNAISMNFMANQLASVVSCTGVK
jgi:hypothetical protein